MNNNNPFKKTTIYLLILLMCIPGVSLHADPAVIKPIDGIGNTWTLENNVLKTEIEFTDEGKIQMNSFYNKAAQREYLPQGVKPNHSSLFKYNYRLLEAGEDGKAAVVSPQTLDANDSGYVLGTPSQNDIIMTTAQGEDVTSGKRLDIPVTKDGITVTLSFEMFNDSAGLKYQAYIKNDSADKRLQITSSDVIKLDFPDEPKNLHYSYLSKWYSTTGGVDQTNVKKESEDIKVVINRYDSGDGFYIGPEVNSKTQVYRRDPSEADIGKNYLTRSFAGVRAFTGDGVKVATNPEALQLVLFPGEEFEYIAVNMTVFRGDIVDAKMAVEEHLRARFHYNNTSTVLNSNDWEWGRSKRNEQYYKATAVPKLKEAGFDMVMFDDGWNNADDLGISRDGVEPLPSYTENLVDLANYYHDQGLMFGLWYSMSGGYHNRGKDLADPTVISAKKEKIEYMIDNYQLSHQMVDLTEFWVNDGVTDYSHPTDNVYRKNVLTNNVLNEVVDEHPDYKVKYTTEVDIWPSQGDRTNELLHVIDNGWTTSTTEYGESLDIPIFAGLFGHMPLNSVYFNIGNMSSGTMSTYYKYMFARNIKHGAAPDTWSQDNIDLMAQFNSWRKSERIRTLTDTIIRPVYNGSGWDSNIAADWDQNGGPYVLMHVSKQKDQALMIATGGGKTGSPQVNINLRWLDPVKQYLIEDITLDDTGVFAYRFNGLLTGEQLKSFVIDLDGNSSKGKAYWIEEYRGDAYQILYADENINSYQLTMDGEEIVINGTGKAQGSGKIVVYGKDENAVMVVNVNFGANGNGTLKIAEFEPTEDVFIPTLPSAVTYIAADLYDEGKTSVNIGTQAKVNSGSTPNASPQGGINFTSTTTASGSYIEFIIDVQKAGVYDVEAAAKVSTSRGIGQWYIEGSKAGGIWNQMEAEKIKFHDLGTVTFETAGSKVLRFEFQGGTNKTINTDRIVLTPVLADSGLTLEAEKAKEITLSSGSSASLGTDVNASGGGYVTGTMSAIGDNLSLEFDVDKAGTYEVVVSHKVHQQRGIVQLFINDDPIGDPYDQYENTINSAFKENNYGSYTFTPGEYTFKFEVVGKNEAATNFNTSIDAIKLQAKEPGITITGDTDVVVGSNITLNVELSGMDPFYSTGNYVKWIIDSQVSDNGANKVISMSSNGLESLVTGVNPGTARLKVISMVDAKVVGYVDITVKSADYIPPLISSVVVTGIALSRQLLTGEVIFSKGEKDAIVEDFEFQWLRNGSPIDGATGITYTANLADIDQVISVTVTPVDVSGTKGTAVISEGRLISMATGSILLLEPIEVSTTTGTAPELPSVTTAVYDDGTKLEMQVLWDHIEPVQYEQAGQFDVSGDVVGTELRALAHVTVHAADIPAGIAKVLPISVTTVARIAPVLPSVVSAVYDNGVSKVLPVVWDSIEVALYSEIGAFDIGGDVPGTEIRAVAHITVIPDGYVDSVNPINSGSTGSTGKVNDSATTVVIDRELWAKALSEVKDGRISIKIPLEKSNPQVTVQIQTSLLLADDDNSKLTDLVITVGGTSAEFPLQELRKRLATDNTRSFQWIVFQMDATKASQQVEKLLGSSPMYRFEIKVDGRSSVDFDGMPVKLAIDFELNSGNTPENVVVYHISEEGIDKPVAIGLYDAESQAVKFRTTSLGTYGVIYNNVSFNDITDIAWAKIAIEALAAREVVNGVDGKSFIPREKVTRAEFTTLLMNTFGFEAKNTNASNYADVEAGAWHSGLIAAAQQLGIVSGTGNGEFGPNEEISRQDMTVMVYNIIQVAGITQNTGAGMTEFKDEATVSGYAAEAVGTMQQAGIITGSGDGNFLPHNNASRAEAAVIIFNLIQAMI